MTAGSRSKGPATRGDALSRRSFLWGAAAAGVGTFAAPMLLRNLAHAAACNPDAPKRHYIFCFFGGGWDTLLCLDPRDPTRFTNDNIAVTGIQPAYNLATSSSNPVRDALGDGRMMLGPFMGELFEHAHRLCIVRGMMMDTLTHETGRRRFLTGRPPAGLLARGTSMDVALTSLLLEHSGESPPIPNLSMGVESYNVDEPPRASALKARGADDLVRILRPEGPSLSTHAKAQIDALLRRQNNCPDALRSDTWGQTEAARRDGRALVSNGLDSAFDLAADTPEMNALRAHYGIARSEINSPAGRAALAATAVMRGVSRVVSFDAVGGLRLDTHAATWGDDHGPYLTVGFNAVARMLSHLASVEYPGNPGSSWLDHTVVVGYSEFCRTPLLNAANGRDHWLTNACFLAGGPIAGGRVLGASSNFGMNPMPMHLETGTPLGLDADLRLPAPEDAEHRTVKPEHIIQALTDEIGIEGLTPDLGVPPLNAIFRACG